MLREVAAQIGNHLSRPYGSDGQNWWVSTQGNFRPLLAESLQIWNLGNVAMQAIRHRLTGISKNHRLIEFAENTSRWHHQIRREGGPAVAFAHSIRIIGRGGQSRCEVRSVAISPLATAIDAALKHADAIADSERDDDLIRLLVIPGAHIYALWIQEPQMDRILVASRPSGKLRLSLKRLYDWHGFLRFLSRNFDKCLGPAVDKAGEGMTRGATEQ
jgi:hypothetical protein